MADEIKIAKEKLRHKLRSEFNYNVGLLRIDFKHGQMQEALNELDEKALRGDLVEFTIDKTVVGG